MAPWAARVPVPLRLPAVSVVVPATVRVVPAAMVVVARKSTEAKVWLPVIVPPAKTRAAVPGSSVPPVYVQLLLVRIVPARLSVPESLLMTNTGRLPAAVVEAPVRVCAPVPLTSRVAVPPEYVDAWLMAPWAASVPVPLRLPAVSVVVPVTVRVVPAAMVVVARRSIELKVWLPVIVPPAKTSAAEPGSSVPPVYVQLLLVRIVPRQAERARGLVDDQDREAAADGRRGARERLGTGAGQHQGRRAAAVAERLADIGEGGRVPVPLRLPAVRLTAPVAVSVVPAAMVVVARKSTEAKVWLPVIVPPAKTIVDVPASSVPAVYVQLFVIRIVPARRERARGLVDDEHGQVARRGGRRAGERLGSRAVDEQGGRPAGVRRCLADGALGGEDAGAVEAARRQRGGAGDGQGRARGDGFRPGSQRQIVECCRRRDRERGRSRAER